MSITMNMWVREQMAKDEGKAEGKAEGKIEGKAEGQKAIIVNMLKQNLDYAKIACLTGLPEAEVQTVAEAVKAKNV
jgi:predicted transposase/invertase (TIGR01784 family)